MTTATQNWFDAVGAIFLEVDAIKHVHAGGKGTHPTSQAVEPMVDAIEEITVFLGHGGIDPIIASSWQRATHSLLGSLYIPRNPIQERYAEAIELIDPVMEAFEAHAKGFAAETRLQSVVLKTLEGISAREWPAQSNRWFLVMTWAIEAQVNRAATYTAA